jgi:serine/threonine protein kinase
LREGKGLQISAVLDGAWTRLQLLIQYATHPEVTTRLESVAEFLDELDRLEEEITAPEERPHPDPIGARPGDELDHGIVVKKRLGHGSTAVALLVERDGKEQVLKVALSPEHNERLRAEGDVLRQLRHQYIVELYEVLRFGDRLGLLMAKAGDSTLADRVREEGRLHLELLERFGEDLLVTIDWLEQKGIPHRDIKPENLGTAKLGDQLHLVLFDFSLARTPAENILAGTRHYLDPFLALRKPPRWDTYAERFAAAVTLYQMATGSLPQWGDGRSEPAVLDCEATIDADAFEPAVREGMATFFTKALRRDFAKRFDNAQEIPEWPASATEVRIAFFFHFLDLHRPLLTAAGPVQLPAPSPRPARLDFLHYEPPC